MLAETLYMYGEGSMYRVFIMIFCWELLQERLRFSIRLGVYQMGVACLNRYYLCIVILFRLSFSIYPTGSHISILVFAAMYGTNVQ